jgi:hypothetical protein
MPGIEHAPFPSLTPWDEPQRAVFVGDKDFLVLIVLAVFPDTLLIALFEVIVQQDVVLQHQSPFKSLCNDTLVSQEVGDGAQRTGHLAQHFLLTVPEILFQTGRHLSLIMAFVDHLIVQPDTVQHSIDVLSAFFQAVWVYN